MDINELKSAYKELERLRGKYLISYGRYENGRNKKIRIDAQRECENIIHLAMYNIKKHEELFDIAAGSSDNPMTRAEYISDLQKLNWFSRDMRDILERIEEKISSFK